MSGGHFPIIDRSQQGSEETTSRAFDGPLAHFNGHARITGPCGDTMEFWIRVDGQLVA